MPQIQILPSIPTFGSRLFESLGNAGVNIAEGFKQKSNRTAIDNLTKELADPNKTDLQKVGIISKLTQRLGPEASKSLMPFLSDLYTNSGQGGGQPPGTPHVPGVPQGPTESVGALAPLQPTEFQNAPSPTGQTDEERSLRRQSLARRSAFPGGRGAENLLKLDIEEEKLRLKKEEAELSHARAKEKTQNEQQFKRETQYLKTNEPQLIKLAEDNQNLKIQDTKFGRLEELFKDKSKFPSAFTASLAMNKEGQIRPVAGAFLSPEAQEAVKLIQDELSGAQKTFGGKVSNFEVGQYLKRLPSLLNTPEGRDRVLRDLRMINQINRVHNEGIQEIFEEFGGPGSIPYSKAESIFQKRHKDQIEEWSKEFINPEKKTYSELPTGEKFIGKKIRDKETGEEFIYNGKEWNPVEKSVNK